MFYVAWLADGGQAFSVAHHRVDETVFAFELEHAEGDFATLTLDIINPQVGLLSPARFQWLWFSWRKPDQSVVPLFHGRVVGIPEDLTEKIIRISLVGRPENFEEQKAARAAELRELPWFDPVWIEPSKIRDPDTVLETRASLYHVGRTDKTVTVSNSLDGEDGTLALDGVKIFADTVGLSYSGQPLRQVVVNAEVNWIQRASGEVDVTAPLYAAFAEAGSSQFISSYTGQGLERTWLINGDLIGGGWFVSADRLTLLSGDGITPTYIETPITPDSEDDDDDAQDTVDPEHKARFYLWVFSAELKVSYEAERDRSESLTFILNAGVQDLATGSDDARSETMDFSSSAVGEAVDDVPGDDTFTGENLPIGSLKQRHYFNQNRGKRSLEFLILLARARLLMASRAAVLSGEIPFDLAVTLSCRMNASMTLPGIIPGDNAVGKVVYYKFGLDGAKGALYAALSFACMIGRGESLTPPAEGVPCYAEDGILEPGIQQMIGAEIEVVGGDIGGAKYVDFDQAIEDDGLNFDQLDTSRAVLDMRVVNGEAAQQETLEAEYPDIQAAVNALNQDSDTVAGFTRVQMNLRPVTGGPFHTDYTVAVSALSIPRNLDLEAT